MLTTRRSVLGTGAAALAIIATACQRSVGGSSGASTALNNLLDQISTQFLHEAPEYATSLAVTEQQAGGRYIDRLSDASKQGLEKGKSILQNAISRLNAIDRNSLSHNDQVTLDVCKTAFGDQLNALQWEVGGGATSPYVVSQLTGSYTGTPDFLDSQHPIHTRDQVEAYITRLTLYGHQLDQETQRIGEDSAAGVIPPDFAIRKAIDQLNGFASKTPAQTVLVQSLQRRLPDVQEISANERAGYISRATAAVHDAVLPAYHRQVQALQNLLPRATHDAGIWKLPHGAEMYAAALRANTTTNMTPDEVHQMGTELCAQFTSQMDAILRAQGMTNGSVAQRVHSLYSRPDQLYPNTDAGREQCLADLNRMVQTIRARMPERFNRLARANLQIKRVPVYTQEGAPGGYYNGAALDGSRPGTYYINLRDMHENPKFTLPTLSYHEGIPGHHWQISIQQESEGIPFIRRALLGFNAYAEGWALYAEQTADEMGMYNTDPWGKIGYLQSMAFRASRLVVDSGMHAKRWTREQAIRSMMDVTGDNESSVTTEIERYCVWPGQACGYMVGRQHINQLRTQAQQTLGSKFDIRGFNDAVIDSGSMPLSVVDTLVQDWVSSVQRA